MADNPFGGVPRVAVQVVAGVSAAYQTFSTAREASEWFQEGANLYKRARLTQPGATPRMPYDEASMDPTSSSVRVKRAPGFSTRERKAVKACCEAVLEEKFLADTKANAVVPAAGVLQCVNDMNQGTAEGARVASQVTNKYLLIRGVVTLPATATTDVFRLTVLSDHECFGTLCTVSQTLESANFLAIRNYQNRDRFRFLFDKTFVLVNPTTPAAGASVTQQVFEMKIPLDFRTMYNGNAGTIGDVVKNSICVQEISQGGLCTSAWNSQLVYLDG